MQHDNPNLVAGGAIDIGEILVGIWRRKMMIFIFVLVAVGLAVGFVTVADPRYSATAKVLVENLETPFTKARDPDRRDGRIDERDVLSQVEVASSPDIARQVLRGLDDEMQEDFTRHKSPGLFGRLLILAGFRDNPALMQPEQRALANFDENSTIYAIPRSRVIVMKFTAARADTAATVANRLARSYIKATRSAQSVTTGRAEDWLGIQVDTLRQKVVQSEVAVEQFRAQAGLVRGTTNTLSSQELSELNSQMILASAAKAEALARASTIRELLAKTGSVDGASDVMNSVLIQRLREQQVRLRRNLAELSTTYLDNHPRIKSVKQELADLNRQIRAEALKIVNSLEQQASIAATREASLRASLEALKKKASAVGVDEVKLRALEREATANRQLLESFLTRYSDAASRVKPESQPGLARIIETATVPSVPSFPRKGPIVSLAGVGGLALGLGIAFLLEVMAAASRLQQSLVAAAPPPAQSAAVSQSKPAPQSAPPAVQAKVAAAGLGMPAPTPAKPAVAPVAAPAAVPGKPTTATEALCTLPRSPDVATASSNAQSMLNGTNSAYATPIKALSEGVLNYLRASGVKRMAVASLPGTALDGATALVATARCLSEQGLRVVVLEVDAQYNCVDHVVGLQRTAGLAELLTRKAGFSDVIARDRLSTVHFIRSGLEPISGPSRDISLVMEALDHAYDLVLLNNGVTNFPADRDLTGVTSCQSAIVVAGNEQGAEAAALCGALMRAGLATAQVLQLSGSSTISDGQVAAGATAKSA
ncbi:MAG: hypothetical protein HKN11_00245 [Rhizobiales bacterium]|nr:hypothetical protein [Hyphomicrobiales bacterium]